MFRGDCRHLLKRIASESMDSLITDPPYGIELHLQWTRQKKVVLGDGKLEARQLWKEFLPHAARVAKPNTAHLFFGTWKSVWIKELLEEHFAVKGCIVWYKNTWGLGWHIRPRWELAWYCHKGKPPIPPKAGGDVWEHARDHRLLHPCQKPVALLRHCIQLCLPPELRPARTRLKILDPFAGIGSTGVAAVEEQVDFVGMERKSDYVKLARQRLALAEVEMARASRAARARSKPLRIAIKRT